MSLHIIMLRHPDYAITEQGEVYNGKTKRYLKASLHNTGYLTVYVDGKNRLLHRLLAEVFIPNPDNLSCVNHKDGNKLNNDLSNLEWCTHSYNNKHAYEIGLKTCKDRKGDKAFNRKLSSEDVKYIRSVYKKGDSECGATALAKKYNVTPSCICNLIKGRSWEGL